jgi:tRNA (guanine26-N2/guanine27-N2)-dimethyltransferase
MEEQNVEENVKKMWPLPEPTSVKPTPVDYESLTEGKATVIWQKSKKVFYNKAQEANRDLSILLIQMFIDQGTMLEIDVANIHKVIKEQGEDFKGVNILEGLSASGMHF